MAYSTTTKFVPPSSTAKPDNPTVTVTSTVVPNREYTERKQQHGIALMSGTAFSNVMSDTEATTPTTPVPRSLMT